MLIELRTKNGDLVAEPQAFPGVPAPKMVIDLASGSYVISDQPARCRRGDGYDEVYQMPEWIFTLMVSPVSSDGAFKTIDTPRAPGRKRKAITEAVKPVPIVAEEPEDEHVD